MLLRLLQAWNRSGERIETAVVSLLDRGPIGQQIAALGVPVHALEAGRQVPNPASALRLRSIVRGFRPDVVKTWMYHANLVGGVVAKTTGTPVVWGIHHATTDRRSLSARTAAIVAASARLSRLVPSRIVCVSEAGLREHAAAGFAADRLAFIPNGIDVELFARNDAERTRVRAELGIASSTPLVGIVGRVHPDKAHGVFLSAAAQVRRQHPGVRFLLCGTGTAATDLEMTRLVQQHGLGDATFQLGARQDMPAVYSALDLLVSSSATEAFSLTIAEAMSAAVPCIVTDVGDSASIVGSTGSVVPAGSPDRLAEAILRMLALTTDARRTLGRDARVRIEQNFSLASVACRYADLLRSAAAAQGLPVAADAARTELG